MRTVLALGLVCVPTAVTAPAQTAVPEQIVRPAEKLHGLSWVHVELRSKLEAEQQPKRVAVVLGFPIGAQHDPSDRSGMAQVMANLFWFIQRDVPEVRRFRSVVKDRFTLLSASTHRPDLPRCMEFLGKVLAQQVEMDADRLSLALGRARLHADDANVLFPGPVLRRRARALLLSDTPHCRGLAGDPAQMNEVVRSELQDRYRQHYGTRGAVLVTVGEVDGTTMRDLVTRNITRATGSEQRPQLVTPGRPIKVTAETRHPRVEGPFVSAAFPVPSRSDRDYPAYVVATQALLFLCNERYRKFRGGERLARFPFVSHDYLSGDPLLMLNRRGPNGSKLPLPRKEIRDLLDSIHRNGLTDRHIQIAKRSVRSRLATAVPAWRAESTAGLLLLGESPEGLSEKIATVEAADTARVCAAWLSKGPRWLALTPARASVLPEGFRRR